MRPGGLHHAQDRAMAVVVLPSRIRRQGRGFRPVNMERDIIYGAHISGRVA